MNDIPGLVFRWLHIIPAIIMVGGVFFMRFALPAKSAEDSGSVSILDTQEEVRKRWARLVMICTLLLLVSGLYNTAMKAINLDLSPTYNGLLGIKILLALAALFLTALLSGRSERAKRFRQREKHWLNILVVLMLSIVFIAGFMKIDSADFPAKEKKNRAQTQSIESQTVGQLPTSVSS